MQVAKCLLLDTPPFPPIQGTDDSEGIAVYDLCVDHGRSDVGMAQECLFPQFVHIMAEGDRNEKCRSKYQNSAQSTPLLTYLYI